MEVDWVGGGEEELRNREEPQDKQKTAEERNLGSINQRKRPSQGGERE